MKKIGVIFREASEARIKDGIKQSDSFFLVKYSGVSSPDLCNLRMSLRGVSAELFVLKNSIARRALKDYGGEELVKKIDGPCGIVFYKDEPVAASKVLFEFAKGNEKLKLEGGFLDKKVISQKEIETLAKLPSKDVLRAQVVMALKSPMIRLAMTLNGNLQKLVMCLEQIKSKKGS